MSPSLVASEAKSIHQSLKELLKTKEPFDKEVDFQRKNLRRRYLNLLLVHPDAKESKDVENHLWMQTSYAFISSYKQSIAALDRSTQNNQRHQQQQQQQGQRPPPPRQNHDVERRKLVQRFRQFLADEEKFWTQLVLRLRRLFDLREAHPALVALGLLEADNVAASSIPEVSETRDGVMHGASGRNHFQFPPEDPSVSFAPTTAEEREGRLAILSKALICLGDIARYRELYNESNGKRAGHEDGGSGRRGRNRRGGGPDLPPRPRNYDKARQCYEQARLLVPYEGNPSHQLAILSSYQKDSFASLIHYYRALCVSQPYDTAAENLGTVLSKALEMWRQRTKRERDKNGTNDMQLPPRVRVELFKERVVVLHALWRVGMDKGLEKMKSMSPKHNEKVFHDFYALVSERHLPIDLISNTIVLSQGALWKHRMIRDTPSTSHRKTDAAPVQPGTATLIEWGMLDHLMDMHLVLLEVGKDELKDPQIMEEGADDIAQRISATFRRTLPALRIASKWLRANYKYVVQDQEFIAYQSRESSKGINIVKKDENKISGYSKKTQRFWKGYAQFMLALSQAFPANKLHPFLSPLEEDVEMKGFLPLRKLMGEEKGKEKAQVNGAQREQVHPNVEQLMRISDLLEDAKVLVQMENSPLMMINNHIMFDPLMVEEVRPRLQQEVSPVVDNDSATSNHAQAPPVHDDTGKQIEPDVDIEDVDHLSSTDDDPVGEAFEHLKTGGNVLDEEEDDEEEDEIVWDPRAPISPALSPITRVAPLTPVKPIISPKGLSPRSPTHYQPIKQPSFTTPATHAPAPQAVTTAQDLLNDVMGLATVGRVINPAHVPSTESVSTAPQPQFLFGSELSHRPSQSIWSASEDEQPLMYSGNTSNSTAQSGGHIYQTSPRQFAISPASQDLSQQSIWSSPYPSQLTHNSQQSLGGGLPPAYSHSHSHPPQPMLSPVGMAQRQHQRVPSASVAAQLFPNHIQSQHDPFAYAPPIQPPIHRPEHILSPQSGYINSHASQQSFGGGSTEYYASSNPAYHSRQLSMHDPRVGHVSVPMSQIWSHTG
uniref:Protein SMG7 n=1 Tax=Psilocybe cubensis TaxID=181762 RepID=A0A8H7XU36_PSICU